MWTCVTDVPFNGFLADTNITAENVLYITSECTSIPGKIIYRNFCQLHRISNYIKIPTLYRMKLCNTIYPLIEVLDHGIRIIMAKENVWTCKTSNVVLHY